jgi:hypothetical protein
VTRKQRKKQRKQRKARASQMRAPESQLYDFKGIIGSHIRARLAEHRFVKPQPAVLVFTPLEAKLVATSRVTATLSTQPRPRVIAAMREGEWVIRWASVLFGPRKMERVFAKLIEDMRYELREAESVGDRPKAVMARVRGYCAVMRAAGLLKLLQAIGKAIAVIKAIS